MSTPATLPAFCQNLVKDKRFEWAIIIVIGLAGILVGLETSATLMNQYGSLLHFLDKIILTIFTLEIAIKMVAYWPNVWRYFQNGWNIFDFVIVAICFLPFGGLWVGVIRLVRILRVVRLITQIPRLQVLVGALLKSLPSLGYVSLLLGLYFYIYGVMGVFFFRGNDPGHFGDLGISLLSLFRVVTLEDWTDVMYSAIYGTHVYPAQGAIPVGPDPQAFGGWAVIYFVSFVMIGAMVMINLFVGVMVTGISDSHAEQLRDKLKTEGSEQDQKIEQSLQRIEEELNDLRSSIKENKNNDR